MSDLTNFAENAIIDAVLRGQALGTPANWHIALFTADPTETGSTAAEVSGGSYARQAVAASLTAWSGTQGAGTTVASNGTGGRSSNNAAITFGPATADWGTVTHVGFMSASTGGNMWIRRTLTASRLVQTGDTLTFAADALGVTAA